jgi:hypothetical protein
MKRFMSSRPQVVPKKNRNEMMRTLKVLTDTPSCVILS